MIALEATMDMVSFWAYWYFYFFNH